jgi:squalene cyclase
MADYLWVKGEGMLVNGTNGVQCWDTAFTIQAVMDAGLAEDAKWKPMLTRALEFLEDQQMRKMSMTKLYAIDNNGKAVGLSVTRSKGML